MRLAPDGGAVEPDRSRESERHRRETDREADRIHAPLDGEGGRRGDDGEPGERVADEQHEGIVEYLGTAEDVRPLIAEADCVVLPSYREGAPRTLIEAAAMARPVIATDVPGCRAVVDDKVTGLLCAPRSAECLSQALFAFLDLPHTRRLAMGQAGRRKMEQEFDQDLVIEAYRSGDRRKALVA